MNYHIIVEFMGILTHLAIITFVLFCFSCIRHPPFFDNFITQVSTWKKFTFYFSFTIYANILTKAKGKVKVFVSSPDIHKYASSSDFNFQLARWLSM